MNEKKNYYQLVPKKELKCVWMTAGLLTYKLCKYDLQCERCPLDWELRNLSATPSFHPTAFREVKNIDSGSLPPQEKEKPDEKFPGEDLFRLDIKGSFFYHPGHTWVKVEKADEVRVGLDCFIRRMIGKVNVIVLPLSGTRCRRGENLCSIIQEEGILDIVFPLSGSILSVNQKLKDQPDLINKDPMGDGFLLILKPKNLQRDQQYLFSGEAALSWYRKDLERFKTAIISELNGQERIGITMQDGGISLGDVKKIVAPERYIQVVSAFLRNGEKDFQVSKRESMEHSKSRLG
ncbi:MAG TPA: glycine cleavage system protein H [Thermodesulfobacteriota bacterium]|nr:glycine cleavage system protein H [Thermodesulfobacteriota bacterium]